MRWQVQKWEDGKTEFKTVCEGTEMKAKAYYEKVRKNPHPGFNGGYILLRLESTTSVIVSKFNTRIVPKKGVPSD